MNAMHHIRPAHKRDGPNLQVGESLSKLGKVARKWTEAKKEEQGYAENLLTIIGFSFAKCRGLAYLNKLKLTLSLLSSAER
jgi:hypothetical protein